MAQKGPKRREVPFNPKALAQFPPNERYLIGVSGGRDSVALLHWLGSFCYKRLIVCHLDHQLRGRSAAADARFVQRLAARNGFSFESGRADIRKIAADGKRSIETAAREARYSFFARVARRRRCRTIFLGHHADDLVETFLINLFRGTGLQGQRGIRAVSTREIDGVQLKIVRPLLGVWRSEIDEYINAHKLRYREDATNTDLKPLRNRLRHRIIPILENELGRNIRKAVCRAADIALEEDALLQAMLPESSATLPVKTMREMPVALQRRGIARWLRDCAIADVGFEMVEQVRTLLDASGVPAKVNLTNGRHARRREGALFIE